jgi:predicted metal-dependent HD superfamily phosphohydrolase
MLKEFEVVRHLASDPSAIEFAIWYHDSVYKSRNKENEEESAYTFSCATLFIMREHRNLSEKVIRMILATKHGEIPSDPDTQLLCDLDLAILGQTDEVFDKYEEDIRIEYGWVPEADFRAGRRKILQSFLDRPSIYSTVHFRDKYELAARRNLTRSIERLSA